MKIHRSISNVLFALGISVPITGITVILMESDTLGLIVLGVVMGGALFVASLLGIIISR